MKLIKTPSFDLAINTYGDENSEKVALMMPGRLDTKDYAHMISHAQLLAGKGFYAVAFDPPYTWDSPGDTKSYSTTNYMKAVNELINYFGIRPTLLVGHSRGGAVAQLVSDNSSVKGLVLAMASYESAPTPPDLKNVKDDIFLDYRDLPPGTTRTVKKKEMPTPMNYFKDAAQYDPTESLKRFVGAKLMICGTKDEFIKPEEVKEIFDLLNEPKMFLELDTEHDYRLHADMVKRVNEAIGEFLTKYWR